MFTGIVEEIGKVTGLRKMSAGQTLQISAKLTTKDVSLGDSIAVNGVCLTVTGLTSTSFTADVMQETLDRSGLGRLRRGSAVNLERAMQVGGRLGGHMVTGHIDGQGTILSVIPEGNAVWYAIGASEDIMRYVIRKGSVAVDGISLTVAEVNAGNFRVSVIPHTERQTILSQKRKGELVNLENDCIGKYVEKLLVSSESRREHPEPSLHFQGVQQDIRKPSARSPGTQRGALKKPPHFQRAQRGGAKSPPQGTKQGITEMLAQWD